ncbi:MAG: polysaccharide lyase [Cyanobacteria bacterium P01_A01_bin.135]
MRPLILVSSVVLIASLSNCSSPASVSAPSTRSTLADTPMDSAPSLLWSNGFGQFWRQRWQLEEQGTWGLENVEVVRGLEDCFERVLRVHYPAESASPATARQAGVPIGGAEFRGQLGLAPRDRLRLSYYVRFSDNFAFVKGGKLPGLYGGIANSGGNIPDGTDGFSTRMMWRENGVGEVYAYLPTSEGYGTSIRQGEWVFRPGRWHHVVQEIHLNQPGQADGKIRVWFDDTLVVDRADITFRSTAQLQIDGIFFSTFFGGGDRSWATPNSVYADFAAFSVSTVP